jgi:uncharacterized glyoxalase superfamily protein PhnB
MKIENITPILNVSDIASSVAWFESLGWQCAFSWNAGGSISAAAMNNEHGPADFAGVRLGEIEIFLCKGAQGHRPGPIADDVCEDATGGVWMSWWLESPAAVDELYALARRLGYQTPMKPTNEPWGVREFHLRHPDGHTIRVSAGTDTHSSACEENSSSRVDS